MPEPIIPVKSLSTQDVLYGDRTTQYRWEVLQHVDGDDYLVGTLDGVADGSLSWLLNAAVKGSGKLQVLDLQQAAPGALRIGDLNLATARIRPVMTLAGGLLPEMPWGTFLVSAATEEWEAAGRVWSLTLLDRCTVPSQDVVEESYAVPAGTVILQEVKEVLASAGENVTIDESDTKATSNPMVWEAGTSKLTIVNDLLSVAGYSALWVDGWGAFRMTPRDLPAERSINYELLGVPRELRDGQQSIYLPDWALDRDSYNVPNKVIAIQSAGGEDDEALTGQWTNTDPDSPYSYPARGRWISHVIDGVECPDGSDAEVEAFLERVARATLIQMSAVQATVKVTHLPIPVRVSDVLRFAHTQADIDARYVITKLDLDASSTGLMKSTLQEVIAL